ncbi:MAG: GDSL-type esterase/lipase family protein [Pyrinomonadaceae bacterium]
MNRFLSLTLLVVLLTTHLAVSVEASGTPTSSGTLNYTALGDSLAFGILDLSVGGYVPRYGSYVQTDTASGVSLTNLGQNGWTSAQLLNALRTNATFRTSIANSQVVTWDIGGNDFLRIINSYKGGTCGGADNQDCLRVNLAAFKANWSAIITEILALRSINNTIIRTMDIYNPFVKAEKASDSWANDGGLNDFQALKPYVDDANNYINTTAAANNIPCAKVYQAFNGANGDEDAGDKGYISPYDSSGVHPGDLGHKVIADLFRKLGYAPLVGQNSPATPVLLTEENSNRAAAVDSVTLVRDPFPVFTTYNLSADRHTRIILFATNATLLPGETMSAMTAQAEDSQHRVYPLTIEYAGNVPNINSLTQVIVKLPDELARGGDVLISINLHGTASNQALVSIKPSAGN